MTIEYFHTQNDEKALDYKIGIQKMLRKPEVMTVYSQQQGG